MFFYLNDHQRSFRQEVRQLVEEHVVPGAASRDEKETFPAEALLALAAHELLGIGVRIVSGGLGPDPLCSAV